MYSRYVPNKLLIAHKSRQTPRIDYFPWQYIKVATRDVIAVRRLKSRLLFTYNDDSIRDRFRKKWPRGSDWSDSKFKWLHSTGKL